MSEQIADIYDDVSEFEELLEAAEAESSTAWEMEFLDGVRNRYEKYHDGTYISEKQIEILERIAKI